MFSLIFTLIVIGVIMYLVSIAPFLNPWIKQVIGALLVLLVLWCLLGYFGVVSAIHFPPK